MAYGEPRLTTDIAVVIVLSENTISGIVAGFDATDFYIPPRAVARAFQLDSRCDGVGAGRV